MSKILVGLSGGVDSSVAAALLVEQGHEVVAAYMKNWVNTEGIPGDCPWEQDIDDAYAVASKLGIEFRVLDLVEQYQNRIVNYLLEGYRQGYTPNPDVLCNREMKFGVFLDYALEQGFEQVATGHYARLAALDGNTLVQRGVDNTKDQSYFLALLGSQQLAHANFPVGELQKSRVREIAKRFDLAVAGKKDSQGICFIGQVKMSDFLRHYIKDQPGEIVDTGGKVLGKHLGLHLFTIGQRKGHGVASPKHGVAYVVVGKDLVNNRLIVGYEDNTTPGLYHQSVIVGGIANAGERLYDGQTLCIQPRYRCPGQPASIKQMDDGRYLVEFVEAQRAIALGQVCAFYDQQDSLLLAGGFFEEFPEGSSRA